MVTLKFVLHERFWSLLKVTCKYKLMHIAAWLKKIKVLECHNHIYLQAKHGGFLRGPKMLGPYKLLSTWKQGFSMK